MSIDKEVIFDSDIFSHSKQKKKSIISSIQNFIDYFHFSSDEKNNKQNLIYEMNSNLTFENLDYYLQKTQELIQKSNGFTSNIKPEIFDELLTYIEKIENDFIKETETIIGEFDNEDEFHDDMISDLKSVEEIAQDESNDVQDKILNKVKNLSSTLNNYKSLKREQVKKLEHCIKKQKSKINQLKKDYQEMALNFNEKMEELSEKTLMDPLTNVYNRRGYDNILDQQMTALEKNKISSLHLIVCDIDRFKPINDKYGHDAGDAALKRITSVMLRHLREQDDLFRIGGEEFAIIIEDCSLEQSLLIVERIRKAIEKATFKYHNEFLKITSSFGVTEITKNLNANDALASADKCLYISKNNGRNQIHYYEQSSNEIIQYKR